MIKSFQGKTPKIAPTAFVSDMAVIIGDVHIGGNASVWPGAVIRGDLGSIIIGSDTAVEDNCVLHAGTPTGASPDLEIGANVHIGHGAVINCRRIGSHTLIGMNATVLHDAEIGEYCIIGAACMVSHAMKVPDRSFVAGVPAKIMGEVTPKQRRWADLGTRYYQELAKKYKTTEDISSK